MKIHVPLAAVVLGVCTSLALGADGVHNPRSFGQPDQIGGHATTHVIVRVRPGVAVLGAADGGPAFIAPDGGPHFALAGVLQQWGVTDATPVIELDDADRARAAAFRLDRYYRVHTPVGTATPDLAAALRAFEAVFEHVELDGIGGVAAVDPPNDPSFDLLYGMHNTGQPILGTPGTPGMDINALAAWEYTTGDASLVIGVLDSGVNEHPEIADKMIPGVNVVDDSGDTSDSCDHGTHVAGTIAANANNAAGVAGVAWEATLVPVRMLNGCSGPESDLAEALFWSAANDVDIANLSLQYFSGTQLLHDSVLAARDAGVVLVCAAGNFPGFGVAYPARWPETMAIANVNNQGVRVGSSGQGSELTVSGPGWNVYSLSGASGYGYKTGTSMATPHVAGTAALMLALDPGLDHDGIEAILTATTMDVDDPGYDTDTGWGLVDAAAALAEVESGLGSPADLDGDGSVGPSDLALLLASWGPCGSCGADLDGDGSVGASDIAILLAAWG